METARLTSGGFEMPVDAWSFIGVCFGSAWVIRLDVDWTWFGLRLAKPNQVQSKRTSNPNPVSIQVRSGLQ